MQVILGVLIPFVGTALGAACVFVMKKNLGEGIGCVLNGFAGGVMAAASVWSLIIPSIEQSSNMGALAVIPACSGFFLGVFGLLAIDRIINRLYSERHKTKHIGGKEHRVAMMIPAVTLHNIPEGMAVGVVYAGYLSGNVPLASAFALSLGIAIQNFPEGAIISMPLKAKGRSKARAFLGGAASGIVEPIGALLAISAAEAVVPAMPYFLSFAAGAMVYVVVEELIPEVAQGKKGVGTVFFALGFCVMMALDVILG